MSYSSLSGSLRSTCKNYVCHFVFTSAGMCSLLCLNSNNNKKKTTQLPGSSKLREGNLTQELNVVVDFFKMWCFYLIYLLHVFCYLSKHVLWKSSSLNVKLIIAVICLFINLEVWRKRMVFVTWKISPMGHKWNMWCTPTERCHHTWVVFRTVLWYDVGL